MSRMWYAVVSTADWRYVMKIVVAPDVQHVAEAAFKVMKNTVSEKKDAVLGLATGSSPEGLYALMAKDHTENGTSYQDVVTYNLDEYVGLPQNHPQSYYTFMHEKLFQYIDVKEENIHIPCGCAQDEEKACHDYENMLARVRIDLQVLGIGSDGHIAFNEPGTPFDSLVHLVHLKQQTIHDNARFFDHDESKVPTMAITTGLADIMRCRKIILIATGANKAQAVHDMVKGPVSTSCPASILQRHPDTVVFLDEAAASKL